MPPFNKRPPPPPRNVWADVTKELLQQKQQQLQQLGLEIEDIRQRCNHTHANGMSALVKFDDDSAFDGRSTFNRCEVCNTTV